MDGLAEWTFEDHNPERRCPLIFRIMVYDIPIKVGDIVTVTVGDLAMRYKVTFARPSEMAGQLATAKLQREGD